MQWWKWVLVGWMMPLCVVAQESVSPVIEINDSFDHRDFMPSQIVYFLDTANQFSFQQIASPSFADRFTRHASYQNSDFRENATYWIKVDLKKNTESGNVWLIEFYDQTIDTLIAFLPGKEGYRKIALGDHSNFSSRLFLHKNFELPIRFDEGQNITYYFKLRSHEFADLRFTLRSVNYFVYYALNEYYLYGMFYGMILIIVLYNFMVFLAIREIKFIYYIAYILSVALYAMSYDGVGFQFLWPQHPQFNDWMVGISLYSLIIWSLIFTRRFLSTRANAPALDRWFGRIILIRSAWFVLAMAFFPELLSFRLLEVIPLSLVFFTAIQVWRRGYRPARFFVMAYGVLFFGFFVRLLVYFNVIPFTTITHYSLHFSFVFEMLFLTVALGDRIRILKDNRDRALKRVISQQQTNITLKDKVNQELEQKVKERTIEIDLKNSQLEESNLKLIQQAKEINQINSMLDLDNWKLKNKVKEVLEERLHEQKMTYEEFLTLYPDSLSCYRFLDELKWSNGYECHKCGNAKYFDGAHKFSKRCTRCGYDESVTAFTLFHRVRFPIDKAFYIAYLTVSGRKEFTLEKLSAILNLRINTISDFSRKVLQRKEAREQKNKMPVTEWEQVIKDETKGKRPSVKGLGEATIYQN